MRIDPTISADDLASAAERVCVLAARKVRAIDRSWDAEHGTPVVTVNGKYTTRGWTEWTQGFQYGCMILAGDALDDQRLIELGRRRTVDRMLPHVTHTGVHDHGFNNLSTYGNLLRLHHEGRLGKSEWERTTYENAIAVSGAVQAARWSDVPACPDDPNLASGGGYIYSFNGPHSLFVDTMRTTRILSVAWRLGHVLMGENDARHNLLRRCVLHGLTTSRYIVYHGESGATYDIRGRTAHEGTFNRNDGAFRSRATQQGYSPFSTWTRGLAWAMLGYAEQLEFFDGVDAREFRSSVGLSKSAVMKEYERCARETCDHYIEEVAALDGVPYWDDGAPGLHELGDWQSQPADPFNDHEPVDTSAAAIAAQGLLRLGQHLGIERRGKRYYTAGLCVARTLFADPYLSTKPSHHGLLLHSIYHQPNGWDHTPKGQTVPCGESSLWGDYHLLELAVMIRRIAAGGPALRFFV